MPNIAQVLRDEILRLARKENRNQNAATKRAAAQHRRDIAALKRQVASLQRTVNVLAKRNSRNEPAAVSGAAGGAKLRFVAKGLRSHRARLGLSAGEFGKLVGASANSVYAWETGKTVPRREQVAKIAAVRLMGKREAVQRLKGAR
ncbi:MAG: helix-turn-helix transcriptional regulator [Burkholderiales bacterium]